MDRQLVYSGAIPLDLDVLKTNLDAYIGLAKLSGAILGVNSTLLNGFTCSPTAPASLHVSVSAGEIYSYQQIDPTDYGAISADTTHSILKQGVALNAKLLTITPPGTVGYSQNYLIQFAFEQADEDLEILAYYNPFDPTNPYSGPNNSGAADATVRANNVLITAKAGVAASTGTQVTPTPDAGYVGGFVVTVTNGQTTIGAGNISVYDTANFINETLIQKISQATADLRYAQKTQIQAGTLIYGVDTGTANAIVANISPAIASYTQGMTYRITINATNTGPTTVNLNGIGAVNVKLNDGRSTYAGAAQSGMAADLFFNGTNFLLLNPCPVAPTKQEYLSGSGTFTTPPGALFLKVWGAAGGGGGQACSNTSGGYGAVGSAGGNTTFGSITATGGAGGNAAGGVGGTSTGASSNWVGGEGGNGMGGPGASNVDYRGGEGGGSAWLGGGAGLSGGGGSSGATNSGGGGAGGFGGGGSSLRSGGGGGGGGSFYSIISSPSATYSYAIGAGGAGGVGSGGRPSGGAGAAGRILVEIHY